MQQQSATHIDALRKLLHGSSGGSKGTEGLVGEGKGQVTKVNLCVRVLNEGFGHDFVLCERKRIVVRLGNATEERVSLVYVNYKRLGNVLASSNESTGPMQFPSTNLKLP